MNLIAAIESRLGTGWSIAGELGTGATSRVYLARRESDGDRRVVKLMKSGASANERSQYFLLEMQILQKMCHPNVVPITDAGEAQGILFFTMPFIDGETMRERLTREGAFPLGDAARIALDLANALGHVHSQGVVHRDVKPENILLTQQAAILLDFGHARAPAIMPSAESRDAKKYIVGTANYVSPEQVAGRRVADSRSDLYSLGCVLLEMLTGAVPFAAATPRETMQRRLDEPPPDVRAVRHDVPDALATVVKHSLAVDPAERYMSAAQMADALTAALEVVPAN
ncbi:MAG TPA: serine/threonine-protein kinase [Gemmatimonadaceae bacterium]|nr:serine/threonine-protein kinase [Gemmatimonadaceae bacterium]